LLTDEEYARYSKNFVRATACDMLALHGRVEQALELAKINADPSEQAQTLWIIAPAQSQGNDVEGAFRTAALIENEPFRQMAFSLIVVRQAQRGELATAGRLLDRVTNARERERALGAIITAHAKSGAWSEATRLLEGISDPRERKSLERTIAEAKDEPRPSDPDYVERTVAKAKRLRAAVISEFIRELDEPQVNWLRLRCEAEVAMHEAKIAEAVAHLAKMRESHAASPGHQSRWDLVDFAKLCRQAEKPEWAREVCEELLSGCETETGDFAQLGRVHLLDEGFYDISVRLMTEAEVEKWVRRLQAAEEEAGVPTNDVVGGLIAGLVSIGPEGATSAERLYQLCSTPERRFRASYDVMQALTLAKERKSAPKPPNR
ncbi:MAG TPA: hypothetical protein PLV92_09265, partial [Pirellulaceae bacterium]|nr:hypothetical protein [Pirellulaceae bacterium]